MIEGYSVEVCLFDIYHQKRSETITKIITLSIYLEKKHKHTVFELRKTLYAVAGNGVRKDPTTENVLP